MQPLMRSGGSRLLLRPAARALLVAIAAALLLGAGTITAAPAAFGTDDYRVDLSRTLAPGVEYRRLVRSEGPVVAHVIGVRRNATSRLQAVLSNDRVAGPPPTKELTSAMCRRVGCIAAVNGDFFLPSGEPVGAVVQSGRVQRSPEVGHYQLGVSSTGGMSAGTAGWSGRLVSADLGSIDLNGVNRHPAAGGVTLYTPEYGPSAPAATPAAQIVLRIVEIPPLLDSGQTELVEMVGFSERTDATPIPTDGAVLLGQGAGADVLRGLWARSRTHLLGPRALFRIETTPPVLESVGGSPILLREGRIVVVADGSDLVMGRHPRTMVAWNDAESFLVVVDGRQPDYSVGLTLLEAADLMQRLGALEAINLDGGGSTTLSVAGEVVNRPSDRLVLRDGRELIVSRPEPSDTVIGHVERPVADAVALVGAFPITTLEDLAQPGLVTPPAGVAPLGSEDDVASRPLLTAADGPTARPTTRAVATPAQLANQHFQLGSNLVRIAVPVRPVRR